MLSGLPPDRDTPTAVSRRVARNTAYLGFADAAGKAMTFVFTLVAARQLGVEGFGAFSFALAYVTMFATLADLGLGVVTAREIARNCSSARRYIDNSLTIRVLASLVLMALVAISVQLLGYQPLSAYLARVASLFILANAVSLLFAAVFQGFERMHLAALSRVVQTAVLIFGAFLLTRFGGGAPAFVWLYVLGMSSGAALSWVLAARVGASPRPGFDLRFWGGLLRDSLPVGLAAVFGVAYYWSGTALLTRMQGDVAAGLYGAPFRLVLGLSFVSQGFAGAVYPVATRLLSSDPVRARRFVTRALRYVAVLAVGMALLGVALASPVIMLLYGPEYVGSVQVMRVLSLWGGCVSLNIMLSNLLYAAGLPKPVTWQSLVSLILSVGLSLLLVSALSAAGVAVALVAAELVGTGLLSAALVRCVCRPALGHVFVAALKATGSALVAGLLGVYVAGWHAIPGIAVAVVVFLLLICLTGAVNREDRDLLRVALQRSVSDTASRH